MQARQIVLKELQILRDKYSAQIKNFQEETKRRGGVDKDLFLASSKFRDTRDMLDRLISAITKTEPKIASILRKEVLPKLNSVPGTTTEILNAVATAADFIDPISGRRSP